VRLLLSLFKFSRFPNLFVRDLTHDFRNSNPFTLFLLPEASGLDLRQPLAPDDIKAINAAMNKYAVLVWKNQPLSEEEQIAFSESFGPLDIGLKRVFKEGTPKR
jgi:hypothetical protein